jgi:hypothetical protein
MDNLDLAYSCGILKSGGLNPITHDVFTGREDKLINYSWFRRLVYPNVEDFEDIFLSASISNSLVSVLINMKLNENGNYLLDENGKLSVVRIDVQTRWGTYKLSISEFKEIFKVEIRELVLENLLNL